MSGWDGLRPTVKAIDAGLAELAEINRSGGARRSAWMYDLLDGDVQTEHGAHQRAENLGGAFQAGSLNGVEVHGQQRLRHRQFFGHVRGLFAEVSDQLWGFLGHLLKLRRRDASGGQFGADREVES